MGTMSCAAMSFVKSIYFMLQHNKVAFDSRRREHRVFEYRFFLSSRLARPIMHNVALISGCACGLCCVFGFSFAAR